MGRYRFLLQQQKSLGKEALQRPRSPVLPSFSSFRPYHRSEVHLQSYVALCSTKMASFQSVDAEHLRQQVFVKCCICHRVFFDSKNPLPSGPPQTKRQSSTAREKINICIFAFTLRHIRTPQPKSLMVFYRKPLFIASSKYQHTYVTFPSGKCQVFSHG